MYLKEFAEQRNVKPNTVAVYMKSHEKEFKGHTWLKNETFRTEIPNAITCAGN